ncbi:transposase [Halolactibacillus halophilus]|nr:transposase [Halolactibacillus halophilus]
MLWQNDLEDEKKRKIMNEILTKYPKLRPFYAFITSFRQALKDRDMPEFRELILYEKDRQDLLTTHFISRLLSDFPPTLNAIELDENNGFLEGQVNRLKTIKRMLYGRASFPLLRLRILYQP